MYTYTLCVLKTYTYNTCNHGRDMTSRRKMCLRTHIIIIRRIITVLHPDTDFLLPTIQFTSRVWNAVHIVTPLAKTFTYTRKNLLNIYYTRTMIIIILILTSRRRAYIFICTCTGDGFPLYYSRSKFQCVLKYSHSEKMSNQSSKY